MVVEIFKNLQDAVKAEAILRYSGAADVTIEREGENTGNVKVSANPTPALSEEKIKEILSDAQA